MFCDNVYVFDLVCRCRVTEGRGSERTVSDFLFRADRGCLRCYCLFVADYGVDGGSQGGKTFLGLFYWFYDWVLGEGEGVTGGEASNGAGSFDRTVNLRCVFGGAVASFFLKLTLLMITIIVVLTVVSFLDANTTSRDLLRGVRPKR